MSLEALENAVSAMTSGNSALYDVTIVCTTDDHQAEYWMKRLSQSLCKSGDSKFPMVLACSEDWSPGGAGNGLGTLYAYQKACKLAVSKHGIDLADLLTKKQVSAALFHTAGKGTRLAPLPASENNNKPGVKLGVCQKLSSGEFAPVTVLEAVVQQTGVYASSRKGRLSVFWGDQIFLPSAPFVYTPTHHVDIMCTLLGDTAPTAEEWSAQGLEKYGVIAVMDDGNAAQVEKVDHATAVKMLESLGNIGRVGPSLGSFSVSAAILQALCEEYSKELTSKAGKLDTDPHFWMPLTLPEAEYCGLMAQKGIDEAESKKHHQRMAAFKSKLDLSSMGLFGAVDVGANACWWDYGQLRLYSQNNLKLLDTDQDSILLRKFFGIVDKKAGSTLTEGTQVDDTSCVFGCTIKESGSSIVQSVLAGVTAKTVEVDGAIVVNCVAPKITAKKGAILYNLISTTEITAQEGDVMVEVTAQDADPMLLKSHMTVDGGKKWKVKLEYNELTFEEVMKKNQGANISAIETKRQEKYKKVASEL